MTSAVNYVVRNVLRMTVGNRTAMIAISYYDKCNTHFDVQELLLQFWTERHETWYDYEEA